MARAKKPLPSLEWLEPRVKLSRALSLFSFIALLTLLLVWNLAFADLHGARVGVVLAIQLLPLALLAPGMLMGNARAHAWDLLRRQHLLHPGRTGRHRPGARTVRRVGGGNQLRPVLLRPALHPLAFSVRP